MHQELKLIISDNNKIIETLTKQAVDTNPAAMVISLNEFRQMVNTAITKLIEDPEVECDVMEEDEGDSDDDKEDIEVSPKKRKK